MQVFNLPFHHCAIVVSVFAAVVLAATDSRGGDDDDDDGGNEATLEVEWSTYFGGDGTERDARTAVAGDGDVFLAGVSDSYHGVPNGNPQWDVLLVRFDSDGDLRNTVHFGGDGVEYLTGVVARKSNAVHIVGATTSKDSIAYKAQQGSLAGKQDGFIARLEHDGDLRWSTYVGGEADDIVTAVAVGSDGDVYVCGTTWSKNGIATGGAMQSGLSGKSDAFIARYDDDGDLKWSTYFGGKGGDGCRAIAVRDGRIAVAGWTESEYGLTTPNAHKSVYDEQDGVEAFVARFNLKGHRLWGTLLGGGADDMVEAIGIDSDDDIFVAGTTRSKMGIATAGAHQSTIGGDTDLFLVKFGESGKRLWGTYYGGEGPESQAALVVRKESEIYIAGRTESKNGIATMDGLKISRSGGQDLFIVKFDGSGDREWATYFGGEKGESHPALAERGDDRLYLAGVTNSKSGLMIEDAHDKNLSGPSDLFMTQIEED